MTWKIDFLFLAFSSLFSVINPISAAPIFLIMTETTGMNHRKSAWRVSLSALITLAIFAAMGGAIFSFFGITVPAFQIAGGILFSLMSIQELIRGKEEVPDTDGSDPSIVPLGIPLIAGPGAISTVMILVGQAQDTFRLVALSLAILINIALTLTILLASPWIVRKLGVTGQKIVAKIMGLITLVIGIQFVINGTTSVFMEILKSLKA